MSSSSKTHHAVTPRNTRAWLHLFGAVAVLGIAGAAFSCGSDDKEKEPEGTRCATNGNCTELATSNPCMEAFCDIKQGAPGGVCAEKPRDPGPLPQKDQVYGDCKAKQCDGAGTLEVVYDDSDTPKGNDPCKEAKCKEGVGSFVDVPVGTGCGPDMKCFDDMKCRECLVASDCGDGKDKPCGTRTCVEEKCGWANLPDDAEPVGVVNKEYCSKKLCNGAGDLKAVEDPTNVPADTECATWECDGFDTKATLINPGANCSTPSGDPGKCSSDPDQPGCVVESGGG